LQFVRRSRLGAGNPGDPELQNTHQNRGDCGQNRCQCFGEIVGQTSDQNSIQENLKNLTLNTKAKAYVPKKPKESENSQQAEKLNLNLNAEEYKPSPKQADDSNPYQIKQIEDDEESEEEDDEVGSEEDEDGEASEAEETEDTGVQKP
jgi:hypothetical protein